MRYISADHLIEGMILGKPLYGHRGELMLERGMILSNSVILRIQKLQYSGLYIEDEFSEGIEVKDVISDELRNKMSKTVRSLMTNVEFNRDADFRKDMASIKQLLELLVDDVMSSDSVIFNIIDMKQFDLYTYQHSVNVCVLACVVGKVCEMSRKQLYNLASAAILHDIGKLLIDKKLLNKPGKFTPEEFEIMKKHSMLGYECIRQKCQLPHTVAISILQHHEKFNGNGYPFGRREDEITRYAQIISIADVYDAITSKRPYNEPLLPSEAYEYILGNSDQAFKGEIVNIFTKKIAPFPLGLHVQLSNGLEGIVYKNYEDCMTRPLIKLKPLPGQSGENYIDLKNDTSAYNITIQKVFA